MRLQIYLLLFHFPLWWLDCGLCMNNRKNTISCVMSALFLLVNWMQPYFTGYMLIHYTTFKPEISFTIFDAGCYSHFQTKGRRWSGTKSYSMGKNRTVLARCHWDVILPYHTSSWRGDWKGAFGSGYRSLSRV